jgi:hypothetical protein
MVLHYNFDLEVTLKSWEDFFGVGAPWDICSWIWNKFQIQAEERTDVIWGLHSCGQVMKGHCGGPLKV